MVCYTIMIVEVDKQCILSEFLLRNGSGNLPVCALHKGCGKCYVKLLSGIWECSGKILAAPATVMPCCTRLKSCIGSIELPDSFQRSPQIAVAWEGALPLPVQKNSVIAVDMGSTTIAGVRIEEGNIVKQAGVLNRQCRFGDDVISRIEKSEKDFTPLRNALLESVEELLAELNCENVEIIGTAGNTVMNCFLHGVSPASIGCFPFRAPQLFFPERNDLFGGRTLITVPSITGLLGGDIAGGIFVSELEEGELFLDLGTNCEMIFKTKDGLFGTSAAAGPAFEGTGITSGSRAATGAVDRYRGQGDISVIGGGKAVSVCGSALVDFLAVERKKGALNGFGRFVSGKSSFEIAPGVAVSESDIAELLKAKAAVGSAVQALEKYCSFPVKKLKLAGGFSRFLDLGSARSIGLLPAVETKVCGNLSLAGAAYAALKPSAVAEMAKNAEKIREIHLNDIPGFTEMFAKNLLLP